MNSAEHMTDEQFSELLANETATGAMQGHLESCAQCRRELEAIRSAVGDLSALSLRWAEQRAGQVSAPSGWALRWGMLPGWSAALPAVLLFGIGLGTYLERGGQTVAPQRAETRAVAAPSPDELAQDNRLMLSIDQELRQQVRPQVPAAELTVSVHRGRSAHGREVAN
ncbi:MAG TPA: hypothetical protein VM865_08280 [Acidobacteriaceae bacterium]|nr:hypothetical protein [Acidobacteriaceae bacterium]